MRKLAALVTALLALPAVALADPPRRSANPPLGFTVYCMRFPDECRPQDPAAIRYSWTAYFDLRKVNETVNRQIKPRREKIDRWDADVRFGDCDDYVMTKRRKLLAMGYPSSALRMAVVITKSNEMHLVLVVETLNRRLVLNNLTPTIKELKDTSYTFVMMSTADPKKWVF